MGPENGIVYFITKAESGGAQNHVLELLTGFRDKFPLHLAVGAEGELTAQARNLGVSVHVIPYLEHSVRPLQDALALRELVRLVGRLRPALLHAHTSKAGMLGRIAAAISGVPTVYTLHNWVADSGYPLAQRVWSACGERLLRPITPQVIAVSSTIRDRAVRAGLVPADRIVAILNGISDTRFRAVPEAKGVVRIMMVARFAPPKDQRTLIEAVAGMSTDVELCLVGDGPTLEECKNFAQQAGLGPRCRFLGNCENIAELLAQAQIGVLSSRSESLGLTVMEAMRAGLPVVASDVGGVHELVRHGVTGYLCDPGDKHGLRRQLETLARDSERRGAMGRAGRAVFAAEFQASTMLDRTLAIYESVVVQKHRNLPRTSSVTDNYASPPA